MRMLKPNMVRKDFLIDFREKMGEYISNFLIKDCSGCPGKLSKTNRICLINGILFICFSKKTKWVLGPKSNL